MGKTLIIAEKPSVMTDLSRVLARELGQFEKKGTGRDVFFENEKAVITSAVGHLVGALSDPVRMEEAAKLLHISLSSVYDFMVNKVFDGRTNTVDGDIIQNNLGKTCGKSYGIY